MATEFHLQLVDATRTYDERKPIEPSYPSIEPSVADFVVDLKGEVLSSAHAGTHESAPDLDFEELRFAPPGWVELLDNSFHTLISHSPAYSGLMNNVPTSLQEMKGHPWPPGTESYVNVRIKQQYIQSYSKSFNVEPLIRYNTRVEKLSKVGSKWEVRSTTLIRDGSQRGQKARSIEVSVSGNWRGVTDSRQEFDGVIVASGHYHAVSMAFPYIHCFCVDSCFFRRKFPISPA